jgi:hypothetical protein
LDAARQICARRTDGSGTSPAIGAWFKRDDPSSVVVRAALLLSIAALIISVVALVVVIAGGR